MKKVEVITIKVDSETKRKLIEEANKREWSISHYARKLITDALKGSETDSRSQDNTL